MNETTLDRLCCGQHGRIAGITGSLGLSKRLADIGFIKGNGVECVLTGRGIKAYLISGAVIALRDYDAFTVRVNI